jgi:5-methylcytosine-specific restriction endonuclease McrA
MSSFTLDEYERRPSMLTTSFGASRRRKPPKVIQRRLLEEYGNCCAYCDTRVSGQMIHWDHFVSYAYLGTNPDDNWVLACARCNLIKGSMIFGSIDEVREYVAKFGEAP